LTGRQWLLPLLERFLDSLFILLEAPLLFLVVFGPAFPPVGVQLELGRQLRPQVAECLTDDVLLVSDEQQQVARFGPKPLPQLLLHIGRQELFHWPASLPPPSP